MMDKNEAVQKLATAGRLSMSYAEDLYDSFFEKPVVPQYVADWYEEHKDDFEINLFQGIYDASDAFKNEKLSEFENWLMAEDTDTVTTLVNMHQFGYEVEKETRYQVTFKNFASNFRVLKYHLQFKSWFAGNGSKYDYTRMYHTRKELESNGFGWVFSCEGIEIEEVE